MYAYDSQRVRSLAIHARDTYPPTTSAPEIGRRVLTALIAEYRDGKGSEAERARAFADIIGLAAHGATTAAKLLLRESRIKVTRQGNVILVSTGWAVPATVVENGDGGPSAEVQGHTGRVYVQFDFMSWASFHEVHARIKRLLATHDAMDVTFEEIAKLEARYPQATVGEAMRLAGLDPDAMALDLDTASAEQATGTD